MIEYQGEPLAGLYPFAKIEGLQLWAWFPLWLTDSEKEGARGWYQAGKTVSPALLSFSIESSPEPIPIPMLNPFPLPQVGEYGVIESSTSELATYNIQHLPLESRQRWVALGDALRKLSDPLLWPPFSKRTEIASSEITYHNALHSFAVQQQLTRGLTEPTQDLMVREAMLRGSRQHVEQLRTMLQKESLSAQWKEVQRMASQLASDYYEFHETTQRKVKIVHSVEWTKEPPASSEPEPEQEGLQITQPYLITDDSTEAVKPITKKPKSIKKGSRPMQEPTSIIARKQNTITTLNDTFSRDFLPMLLEKDKFMLYEEQKTARYKQNFGKDKGSITIDINPATGEGWDNVQAALNMLGDEVVDAYCAMLAIGIEKNGVEHIREPFLLSPDDVLEICGKVKSNRAYKPIQRAETIKHIKTLSMITVNAMLPLAGNAHRIRKGRGRPRKDDTAKQEGTFIRVKGSLIDLLSFKIGEYSTITGEALWERQSVSIGEWATMIPDLDKRTAIMLRQVLKYSAKNEVYQKRIGRYLTLMFRTNASHGGSFPQGIKMATLLDQSNIKPDYHRPQAFRDAVMRALNRLKQDGVLDSYHQVVDATPGGKEVSVEVREQARGWLDLWLQQKYDFIPPEIIKEQYKPVQEKADEKRKLALTRQKKGTNLPE